MIPTLLRRAREPFSKVTSSAAGASMTETASAASNPYKARKVWPPKFSELTPQQQLRFEKKYKRRLILANQAPRWNKAVKYAQFATLTAAVVYMLFYSEFEWWGQTYKPSQEIRKNFNDVFGIIDKEKRYDRSPDAPLPPSKDE